jgi:hypothetical protein
VPDGQHQLAERARAARPRHGHGCYPRSQAGFSPSPADAQGAACRRGSARWRTGHGELAVAVARALHMVAAARQRLGGHLADRRRDVRPAPPRPAPERCPATMHSTCSAAVFVLPCSPRLPLAQSQHNRLCVALARPAPPRPAITY